MGLSVVILAAGKGTRMKSTKPKVLHPVAKQSLLSHVISTAEGLKPTSIHIVYGFGGEQVKSEINRTDIHWVEQKEQLGTGHAVNQAMPNIPDEDTVLVLYGDVPLTKQDTLAAMVAGSGEQYFSLLTVTLENPAGYGRIVRSVLGHVLKIVEEKDADSDIKQINEVNTGILCANSGALKKWLNQLTNENAQGEYYLTDVIASAVAEGIQIQTHQPEQFEEVLGVNDRLQLAHLERFYQQQRTADYMTEGVTFLDPHRVDFRGNVTFGQDVTIDINVIFEGNVTIGNNVTIHANSIIKNATIDDNTEIQANCIIEDSVIGKKANIGPYARLRPGSELANNVKIGNFVEIKKATIADGSKVNHLSYIGDTTMGANVNVGAGAITCNYDGAYKHQTVIGDNVFIGSDCQLIAPVTVEAGATIGAGSTITKTAPGNQLTLSRGKQISHQNWQRPTKK